MAAACYCSAPGYPLAPMRPPGALGSRPGRQLPRRCCFAARSGGDQTVAAVVLKIGRSLWLSPHMSLADQPGSLR